VPSLQAAMTSFAALRLTEVRTSVPSVGRWQYPNVHAWTPSNREVRSQANAQRPALAHEVPHSM
jgi:hypothetical protein